jgi:signal peptidase I
MRLFPKISKFWIFLLTLGVVRGVFANHYHIPSESMLPTLEVGDHVLVMKRAYDNKAPKRGEVVVFEDVRDSGTLVIKRVIAEPGDQVEIVSDELIINGESARYEEISSSHEFRRLRECWGDTCREIYRIPGVQHPDLSFEVPPGKYFVMGDNRDNSADSRYWGFLPRENIVGQGVRVLWNLRLKGALPSGDLSRVGEKL